jgi:hypothetical protein
LLWGRDDSYKGVRKISTKLYLVILTLVLDVEMFGEGNNTSDVEENR